MTEKFKRPDGRDLEEMRKMEAKTNVVKRADGSASFSFGHSKAIAAVYGPRQLFPQHLQNPEKALLRCYYDMLSFSVTERKRPGPNRRGSEISFEATKALEPAMLIDTFPNTVIDIYANVIEADASTRCAAINAASMALANAGIPMSELVTAVSIGKLDKTLVVDVCKEEEDWEDGEGATDIAVAYLSRSNKISLLHIDGNIKLNQLKEALELAKKACVKIEEIQMQTLKKIEE